jgi:hypothetical protein
MSDVKFLRRRCASRRGNLPDITTIIVFYLDAVEVAEENIRTRLWP